MRRFQLFFVLLVPLADLWCQIPVIEKIALYGNTRTQAHIILRELTLETGQPLIRHRLEKDRAWLLRQGFLKRIEFQTKTGSTPDRRILILVVQEKGTWSFSPILSNNDLFGWYMGARVTTHNLWGRRNRLTASVQLGGYRRFSLTWENPWLAGSWRLFSRLSIHHDAFRYLYGDYFPHFNMTESGINLKLGKHLGRKASAGLSWGLEEIWSEHTPVTLSGLNKDRIPVLGVFMGMDTRDWPLYPRSGTYAHAWVTWYNPFRSHPFQRMGWDLRFYAPVIRDNILAAQFQVDLSRGALPVYRRVHLGGGKTIRGYSTGALHGDHCALMSLEYRFPILYARNPLAGIHFGYAGVLFIDAGAAWFQKEKLSRSSLHGSAGLGIHVIWDQWVLRLEYGNHGTGWGFVNAGTGIKF